ncbi:hypothetical protein Ate02nite_42180 [Paractinoplanes tereljensis]|uniref:Uncharacterized protein n=1 Tax=Paractinoplanes tereljensis TaxID=571912 RepID=A0A919NN03_9ACTN|nr:hypothetical protein Ate02nite_42180 [Actinoplanes tereljensis]
MPRASRVSGTPAGATTLTRSPGRSAGGRTTGLTPACAGEAEVADAAVATPAAVMVIRVRREILTRRTFPGFP